MNPTPIYITPADYSKLRRLLAAALPSNPSAALQKLREELDRAGILDPTAMPTDVVALESTVEFADPARTKSKPTPLVPPNAPTWIKSAGPFWRRLGPLSSGTA